MLVDAIALRCTSFVAT